MGCTARHASVAHLGRLVFTWSAHQRARLAGPADRCPLAASHWTCAPKPVGRHPTSLSDQAAPSHGFPPGASTAALSGAGQPAAREQSRSYPSALSSPTARGWPRRADLPGTGLGLGPDHIGVFQLERQVFVPGAVVPDPPLANADAFH